MATGGFKIAEAYVDITARNLMADALGAAITQIRRVGAEADAVGAKSTATGLLGSKAFLGIAAAAAGVAVETVNMAATFDQKMELIATQAHAPQAEVDALKQKVLDLAPTVGVGPEALATALYHIESVGLRGSAAMDVLTASAKGAKIGLADVDTVTYAMSGVMSVGMKDVKNAADGLAFLNTIVGQGDMTMQGLATAIGTGVLPAFKNAGLGMADFGAALTVLTDNSMPPEVAANRLRTTVQLLQNQSGPAGKALAALGIQAGQLGKDMAAGGLQQALEDVKSHMESFVPAGGKVKLSLDEIKKESKIFYDSLIADGATTDEAKKATERYTTSLESNGTAAVIAGGLLSKAFGGARSASTMETLIGESGKFETKLHTMGDAASRAKQLQDDWNNTQDQLKQKLSESKAGLESLGIQIGEHLMPIVSAIVDKIKDSATWLSNHKRAADDLANTLVVVLGAAFAALIISFGTWLVTSIGGFALDIAKGAWWVTSKLGQFLAVTTGADAEAFATAGRWLYWQGVMLVDVLVTGAKWLAAKIGQFVASSASAAAEGLATSGAWVASNSVVLADQLLTGGKWLAGKIAQYAMATAAAIASAAATTAAWVAANAAAVVASGGIVIAIGLLVAAGIYLYNHWGDVKRIAGEVWNWIKDTIGGTISDIIHGAFALFHQALDGISQAFTSTVDWIKTKWGEIKDAANGPVQWVIDVVYNHGIKPVWNGIASVFGMHQLAGGGVLPGYAPGRDTVPAMLSPGEGVLTPEAVSMVGAGNVLALNAAASGRRAGSAPHGFAGGGIVGDISGMLTDAAGWAKGLFSGALGDASKTPGSGMWRDSWAQLPQRVVDAVIAKAKSWVSDLGSMFTGGGGPAALDGWIATALQLMGMPLTFLPGIKNLIMHESGGNPNAINLTDSNAAAGHPSQGLMQTIPSTFRAYVLPALANLGITNPIANITAGVRYAMANYGPGMLMAGGRHDAAGNYLGYDSGGLLPEGVTSAVNRSGRPERVLTGQQTDLFERLITQLEQQRRRPGLDGGVTVNVTQTSGSPAETGRFVALALRTVS